MTTFDVLFVCTGNICRSPSAERLFLSRVPGSAPVRAGSAGTHALVGHAMDLPTAAVLRELGADSADHVARQLTPAMAAAAHLVLTATTSHRSDVLHIVPAALHHTFTLRESVRLSADLPPRRAAPRGVVVERLIDRVREVADRRGLVPAPAPGQDDIGDPFGAPMEVVRTTGRQIADAVDGVVTALGLGRGT